MPNHIHGIIIINDQNGNIPMLELVETQDFASLRLLKKPSSDNQFGAQSKNLASIVRGYKIGVTKYAYKNNIPFQWQSRFYDHIIRNEKSLKDIRQYITQNPINWQTDAENPVLL
jgi:REP element-mobilizing transposase RayT